MSTSDTLDRTSVPAYTVAKSLFEKTKTPVAARVDRQTNYFDDEGSALSFLVQTVMQPVVNGRPTPAASNLKAIVKAAKVILEAVDDGTLTDSEADAVLTLLTENFATSRIDRIFERISEAPKMGWFSTQARVVHER